MRRGLGWVALVLGFALIAFAPLQRFYAADRLVGLPRDTYQKSTLVASQASYLDTRTGELRNGADLVATSTTRADARASTGKITVLDSFTVVEDPANGTRLDVQAQRAALDRKTSELTNCCGAAVGGDTGVRQSGLAVSWPIGDVRKKTYDFFDLSTKRTWPMRFDTVERIQGIDAYKFVMHVGPTPVSELPGFPGKPLGLDATKTFTVDRVYESQVTTWVDPRTGSPINREQQVTTMLRTKDGAAAMIAASFTLKMTPDSRRRLAKDSGESALLISAIRTIIPLGALVTGAALLLGGLVLLRRPRGRRAA
jgi:hypothetical protein